MTVEIERNRYAPPRSNVDATAPPCPAVFASKGRRFGTLVVDYVAYLLSCVLLGGLIGIIFGQRGMQLISAVPDFVLGLVLMVAYYVFFEGLWARTPGKLVFGTIVVTESGHKPPLLQVVTRTLCRFIPFEPFSFLNALGWHDSISRTRVIRTKP
jgi:uncharacterized RDD family membrane protein YckC